MRVTIPFVFCLVLVLFPQILLAQKASIKEEKISFKTYPYNDPDPVAKMTKFYPYYRFEGMTDNAVQKEWNFVVLENNYIKVYVAPDMGGKVWGAIEKSTGKDFIYFNNEVKFRDIAMRGVWTSGGIEFNFGSIGHAPSTASPVNYKMLENKDGSVSCFVGAPDLTSRTEWRVEVRLPADKAYFETNGFWYNPNGERTSLYNWMTASTDASDDMEYIFPGHGQIGHDGEYDTWPVDREGHNISWYRNNNFGGSKSYHILGSYEEYFSTFFHESNFGMGHWANREERPGMKVFLWSLARDGAIWHELLTDIETNPQYTELQTGFLFNQEAQRSTFSPYKHMFFEGNSENVFSEIWFPVKGTNGMLKADAKGTLNVVKEGDKTIMKFCALQRMDGELIIKSGEQTILKKQVSLQPMQLLEEAIDIKEGDEFFIDLAGTFSYSSSEHKEKLMSRPSVIDQTFDWESPEGMYTEAVELEKQRYYAEALVKYERVLEKEPLHAGALSGKANILYRKMAYTEAEKCASKALSLNTYDPDANFIYGLICKRLGKVYDALEAFGLALRSMKYRAAANLQMAQIYYGKGDYERAEKYAEQSLDYNRNNTETYSILAMIEKLKGNEAEKQTILKKIQKIDPLNTFAAYELDAFSEVMHFEMPWELGLELAIKYYKLGAKKDAIKVLNRFNKHAIVKYWLAYLNNDPLLLKEASAASPELVYPFRSETAEVLNWALYHDDNWKTKYYLALIHWHKSNLIRSKDLLDACKNEADYAAFYLARGDFYITSSPENTEADYLQALSLEKDQWRIYSKLVNLYNLKEAYPRSLTLATEAYGKFKGSYIVGYDYALSLYHNGQYLACLEVLADLNILPNEGARSGHDTYRNANIKLALDYYEEGKYKKAVKQIDRARLWPENLGVGRPHTSDERIEDYLQLQCFKKLGEPLKAEELKRQIMDFTLESSEKGSRKNASTLLGALTLKEGRQLIEADQLMNEWIASNTHNNIAKWAMAVYSGDKNKALKLIVNINSAGKGTPWNPVSYDASFELVKEIHAIYNE